CCPRASRPTTRAATRSRSRPRATSRSGCARSSSPDPVRARRRPGAAACMRARERLESAARSVHEVIRMRTRIVAGNWKLNGSRRFAADLLAEVAAGLPVPGVEVVVLPPATHLAELAGAWSGRGIAFGGQDASEHADGAYTGEVSAAMLADVGARYVLVGHSERRQYHAEDSALVARKFVAARAAGLRPVLCVGESRAEREAGTTAGVIASQLRPVLDLAGVEAFADAV